MIQEPTVSVPMEKWEIAAFIKNMAAIYSGSPRSLADCEDFVRRVAKWGDYLKRAMETRR
ncbi:MAG: hypothetical protein KGL39_59415 [Patescibacteria group bacterium]|nr:hypothetical protein [Patescibacteria group bacterium]